METPMEIMQAQTDVILAGIAPKKTLEQMKQEIDEKTRYAAVLGERNRIMREIYKVDLPIWVWSSIEDIINPRGDKITKI